MPTAAVIFDLDCTITDRRKSIVAFSARFVDAFAASLSPGVTANVVDAVIRSADGNGYQSRRSVCSALRQRLSWRQSVSVDELLAYWRSTFPGCAVARNGFGELLAALRRASIRVGLITNGNGRTQRMKLRAINAEDAFDSVLISEEVGLRKPDRAIFELSLEQLRVAAVDVWYVGDHPVNDVDGARAAGLRALWMAGVHPWPAGLAEPEFVIHSLSELVPGIGSTFGVNRSAVES